jgi:hypothetical protein
MVVILMIPPLGERVPFAKCEISYTREDLITILTSCVGNTIRVRCVEVPALEAQRRARGTSNTWF